ncbi:MAG: ABC transporter ATP-binding protein [Promethearchaeota archaeon]
MKGFKGAKIKPSKKNIQRSVSGESSQESTQYKRKYKDSELLKRSMNYIKPYMFQFSVIIIITLVNAVVRVYPVVLLKEAIDLITQTPPLTSPEPIYAVGFKLILFYLLNWLLSMGNQYFMGFIGQHTTFDLRQEMFIKLQILSFSYYDRRKAGKIMSRVMNDVAAINTLITNGFPVLLGDSVSIVYILYLLFSYSWQLTFITLMVAPFIFIFSKIISKRARKIYRKSRQTIAEVYTKLEQGVAGMKTIKAFTREKESMQEFEQANRTNRDVNIEAGKLMATVGPIFQTIGFGILAVVFIAAFFFLRTGSGFELGSFIAFILLVLQFYNPINQLAGFYNQIQSAMAAGERIFSLLDADVEVAEKEGAIDGVTFKGHVEFKNVYFHYEENIPVLKDINVEIKPKESLAIVGYTGAGKTTMINLLCRFYDPIKGNILIDGIDLRDLSLKCLRSQLGIVLQHPFLFTDTVIENIRYGSNATDEQVIEIAKKIGAHDFIMDLENGYNTQVGERGVLLSQGQRQLISFARALMANPRILILDEATSALDSYSELLLQKAIEEITKNRTSFIIAHRLSTIRNAHKIIVLEKGEIIEEGSHETLLNKNGLYAKLYKLQFRDFELLEDESTEII